MTSEMPVGLGSIKTATGSKAGSTEVATRRDSKQSLYVIRHKPLPQELGCPTESRPDTDRAWRNDA